MRQIVFESEELSVIKTPGRREDVVFVTFEPLVPGERQPGREGFGEAFFAKRGFTAYHFISESNLWYQYPEMPELLAAIRAEIPPGARVVAYGHSMGGYAAIRFADALRADAVLAFSPQASLTLSWEKRWEMARVRRMWDERVPPRDVRIYAVFDPYNLDRRHIRYLSRRATIEPIRVYFCEHDSIFYAQETGLLERIVLDVAADRVDVADLEYRLWSARHDASTYRNYRQRKSTSAFRRFRYRTLERVIEWRLRARLRRRPDPPQPGGGGEAKPADWRAEPSS
ncbi:alpha/beta hydrolase [Ancylobacter sp. G4_0304]|uniref:alpha/beta hydrolase n=1 Tax=Ancylobacter sp. G4_0304 TaxID=3114289 RepID=UPI0039C64E29